MTNIAQRAFSAGEVAPANYARTDLARYHVALRTARNFLIRRDGGAENRPGTEFGALCPTSDVVTLEPFVFNDEQSYVLEFADLSLRIYQDNALIGVTLVTPYVAADLRGLQITQDADELSIVHPNYAPRTLTRTSALVWALDVVTFGPDIAAPGGVTLVPAGTGTFYSWVVTAVSERSGAESYASTSVGKSSVELPSAREITWTAVAGASEYHIYKAHSPNGNVGTYGYVGTSSTTNFYDDGITPDLLDQPPQARALFNAAGLYPGAIANYQERRVLGGSTTEPETIHASRTADQKNFTKSMPSQDDDAITWTLKSKQVNRIQHLVDAERLFAFTSGGEWVIRGGEDGMIRPGEINALNFSKHGSGTLPPIVIDRRILYVQARQAIVREIVQNEVGAGYIGANLTLLSSHLFKGHTIVDWAYQEEPYSVIWCVRDDGVLLGLTTLYEEQVLAWHRHDTDGLVESVCVIPEGDQERLYLVVNRDGVRMVERLAVRELAMEDGIFMDSALSYDGRNTTAETMALSGSTTWEPDELVTVTRSVGGFVAGDVGNRIDFTDDDGEQLRVELTSYTSTTVMQGFPSRDVPVELQGAATATWTRAVDTITGLSHLEGKSLSVLGDGYVVTSPNNPDILPTAVVAGGSVTLPEPYGYIHAGLPYLSDLETLDIDTPSGPSVKERKLFANGVMLYVEASRTAFAGQAFPTGDDPLEDMDETKMRDEDDAETIELRTGIADVTFPAAYTDNGRVAIRNVDPTPLTVLAIMPRGALG